VQHFVSGLDSSWPRNYMLHTITGKFLKSSYFWLLENPGCYNSRRHNFPKSELEKYAPIYPNLVATLS
jgi:hypothetical protein